MENWKELLERASSDQTAWRDIYDNTVDRVFGYIVARVRNKEDAQEIVQEVYLSLFSSLHNFQYQGDAQFFSFLWTVVRRRIIKWRLIHWKRKEVPFEEIYDIPVEENHEDYRYLLEVLETLGSRERLVLELRYFSQYSFAEIAQMTGMSETNAKVIHHRAKTRLRKLLNDYV